MLDNHTRNAIDSIRLRIDQTASIAMAIGSNSDCDKLFQDAFNGIGETLSELAGQLDAVTKRERANG